MKRLLKFILFFSLISCTFSFTNKRITQNNQANLYLNLSKIRNKDGCLYIFLYNYPNQYPKAPYKHYKVTKESMKNGHLTAVIKDVDFYNAYAITVIDDENSNKDLDRFLGLPTEGFGFSNNVKPFVSMPEFNALLFSFLQEGSLQIELQYFL
ncbi:hypothetical protein DNU06_04790 [Putridiphycobacter roseus]|uniref:DUF2141 domain-containing protein n=1 Tax=Putridiphycobacter roseus TaxID=2219161 RepID=A0A2W1N091_9FLAO|nr:DUF2141 domain-containing protein [Putridiphycobacter roseus]PZE17939.1 hypothetical protein DNU06_04790 [Putridiphycobacter roseus]